MNSIKGAVAGMGYVWLNLATLLAQNIEFMVIDIVPEKEYKCIY